MPEKMIELQALVGDSTDNVPGVPGIGPKTAAQLFDEYGDLETLLLHARASIKQQKRRENLIQFAEQARISRQLVELSCDVPLDVPLDDLAVEPVDGVKAVGFCKALEFTALTGRVAAKTGVDPAESRRAAGDRRLAAGRRRCSRARAGHGRLRRPCRSPRAAGRDGWRLSRRLTPAQRRAARRGRETISALGNAADAGGARRKAAAEPRIDVEKYHCIRELEELRRWVAKAREKGILSIELQTTGAGPMQAEISGIALALEPGFAGYVPLGHRGGDGDADIFGGGLEKDQIALADALEALKPALEDAAVMKVGQNIKYDWLVLARHGIEMAPVDDVMLMSYALDAGALKHGHGLGELASDLLGHERIEFKAVAGTGKDKVDLRPRADRPRHRLRRGGRRPRAPPLELLQGAASRRARHARLRAAGAAAGAGARPHGAARHQGRPADPVAPLGELRAEGGGGSRRRSTRWRGRSSTSAPPSSSATSCSASSALAGGKKTKTGQWSTDVKVLEELAEEGVPIARKIVEWRQLTKLKSTYTDAMPGYINPETGRVHTDYALASTSTGRLSSSEPNLQNIPIRTEEGRAIRRAFIADDGHKLVSADYSQIELRVLAHMADIPQLAKAFDDGLDIHAMTASEMFGVPVEGMDPNVRRRAKAINFGIIYGISAFGLAAQLSIPRGEAADYINRYFERFPGIRDYMDKTKAFCREHLYVETLFGRRAHYPEIRSSQPSLRAFQERAAINAPIQGSAADIIRRAMIRMDEALEEAGLNARMLLQVHDELVFEVPEGEIDDTIPVIRHVMENAAMPAVALRVPLKVDARAAHNWDEAH